ncbi:putative uncharacterized protein [Acidaminococcus sp. CAG:917]|nr:putative uncharacterized protein [Acidaminococcus sp. CAG:917]
MTQSDIIAFSVTGAIALLLVILSAVLLSGKGANLIAGFNTLPKEEKEKYDKVKLSRFMGAILLPIAICTPMPALAGYFKIDWLIYLYIAIIVSLCLFALLFANLSGKFKK